MNLGNVAIGRFDIGNLKIEQSKHWQFESWTFKNLKIPSTPQHSDSHPCTRPPLPAFPASRSNQNTLSDSSQWNFPSECSQARIPRTTTPNANPQAEVHKGKCPSYHSPAQLPNLKYPSEAFHPKVPKQSIAKVSKLKCPSGQSQAKACILSLTSEGSLAEISNRRSPNEFLQIEMPRDSYQATAPKQTFSTQDNKTKVPTKDPRQQFHE